MKVLFPFVGDSIGGSHISAADLIEALRSTDVETLVALHRGGPFEGYLAQRRIPYVQLPTARYVKGHGTVKLFRQFCSVAPPLAKFLRAHEVDIVHTNDKRMHYTWPMVAQLAGRRSLLHLRLLPEQCHENRAELKLLLHVPDQIICASERIRDSLPSRLAKKAKALHSIDWDKLRPDRARARSEMLARTGGAEETIIVGFFANLIQRKRPLIFVDAAAGIARSCRRPVAFVMYGDDREELSDTIRARAAGAGIGDRLHMMGFASPVEPLMAGCDLIMVPAVREAFGRTLLEACFAGTPVVAADDAGHHEIYGSVVPEFLAKPDDPEEFCSKALVILTHTDRARDLLNRARRDLSNRYSMASSVRTLQRVYRELLNIS
jgi:glycosyltransferase involved in cell wall biosynthesis